MKIKEFKLALALTAAFVISVHGQATVPFSEDFQDYNVGDTVSASPWSTSIAGVVTNSPVSPDGTSRLLYSADQIALQLNTSVPELYTNMWWSAYAKVHTHTNDPAIGTADAAFFVTDQGELKAYSNTGWVVVKTGLPTSGWIKFAVHLDYATKRYDIYRGEGAYTDGSPLTKQNSAPIPFKGGVSINGELTEVDISGETYLDQFSVVRGNTQPIDETTESAGSAIVGEEDPEEVALSGNLLSGGSLRYFGGTSTLAGPFGTALASSLKNNDKVGVYNAGVWTILTANGAGGWSSGNPASVPVGPSTGFWLDLIDTDARVPQYTVTYSTEDTHTDDPDPEDNIKTGWNLLSLPFTAGNKALGNMLLPGAAGDIVAVNTGGKTYQVRVFNGGWKPNASVTIPAGSGFWYYRNGADATWDYTNL